MKEQRVIQAGPSLVVAGRAMADQPGQTIGVYPYQWLFPGPHSKAVNAQNVIPLTGPGNTDIILQYQVSDGMKLTVRGIAIGFIGTGWSEGSNQLQFTLTVTAAGTRNVEFFTNVRTHIGSLDSPYPILGRLEFEPLDVLTWQVQNTGGPSSSNFAFAHILGAEYPQVEAA